MQIIKFWVWSGMIHCSQRRPTFNISLDIIIIQIAVFIKEYWYKPGLSLPLWLSITYTFLLETTNHLKCIAAHFLARWNIFKKFFFSPNWSQYTVCVISRDRHYSAVTLKIVWENLENRIKICKFNWRLILWKKSS